MLTDENSEDGSPTGAGSEALKLAAEIGNRPDADDESSLEAKDETKDEPGEETVGELRKRLTSAEKMAKDNLSSENRLYAEVQKERTSWMSERQKMEARIAELEKSSGGGAPGKADSNSDPEPDPSEDLDKWLDWQKRDIDRKVEAGVEAAVGKHLTVAEQRKAEAAKADELISDVAEYVHKYHPEMIDVIAAGRVPPELEREVDLWRGKATRMKVGSITLAREYEELKNPDPAKEEERLLRALREKKATMTREGRRLIGPEPLTEEKLRATSWSMIGERAKKGLEGVSDEELFGEL